MNTRIRYKKQDAGHILASKESFLGKENSYSVLIDTTLNHWKVLDKDSNVVTEGVNKTLVEVKKHVKATLKGLGVPFTDEVRNKKDVVEVTEDFSDANDFNESIAFDEPKGDGTGN